MPLHPGLVGQRVVVRRVLPGQQGASGGQAMTDVLGVLESWHESTLEVRRENGELVTIERSQIVTGKPVPPRASTRLRISPERLEQICGLGWPAVSEQALGEWTLRAAGGFTSRANSARVGGDPGLPAPDAIDAVHRFYADHGLPPRAQVVVGSAWQATFEASGWRPAGPGGPDTIVQVASVAQARRRATAARGTQRRQSPAQPAGQPPERPPVNLTETVDEDWMGVYGRAVGVDPAVVRQVLEGGEQVAFARVGDPAVAIGRGVVSGDWLGLQAVEVVPERRGQGLATAIVDELIGWAASRGALSAYLQTLPDNTAALALYAGYGFTTHHAYRYLALADASS